MMKSFLLLMAAGGSLALADAPVNGGAQAPSPKQVPTAPTGAVAPCAPCAPAAPDDLRSPGVHRFTPPTRQQIALRMMVRNLLLQKYDRDQDHELNKEERAALLRDAREAMRRQAEEMLRRFDRDKDGRLNEEERAHMREALSCPSAEGASCAPRPNATAQPSAPPRPSQGGRPPRPGKGNPAGSFAKGGPHGAPTAPPSGNPDKGAAGGSDTAPSPRPRRHHMDQSARLVAFMAQHLIMATYDTNHNGQLDAEERARFTEDGEWLYTTREATLLKQYDTDGDGRLSEEELNAALQTLLPPRPSHPQREGGRPGKRTASSGERTGGPGDAPAPRAGERRGLNLFDEAPAQEKSSPNRKSREAQPRKEHPRQASPWKAPGRKGNLRGDEARRRGGPPPHRNAIDRMLDTHFDVDILLHLARPKGSEEAASPTPPDA